MGNKWNDEEIIILKEIFSKTNDVDILKYFSGRTLISIKIKAKRLKLYRTDVIIKQNISISRTGEKNGMFGKTSKIKGKTYVEFYGDEKSEIIKNKLSNNKLGKIGLSGNKNGMFGKVPYNKGISPSESIKNKIKQGIGNYWHSLSETDLNKRKNKLREDWLIKRNKYIEIDTVPEKITEILLLELNIVYDKKINIGYYNCDFVINDLIIEVQGDYWHANPKFYNTFDKIQQKNINRDKRKLKFLQTKGYTVLYFWEYDLKNNANQCKEQLKKYL
jgi:G:T-mismatch repair DNA endonuclease (very short patch repair protein)